MKTWAIANQKGGVGKTTTTVSLAGHLVLQGSRVLVVDMDPHGSLTAYFGNDPDELEKSIYQLFHGHHQPALQEVESLLLPTGIEGLDLLPASTAMATLDRQLGTQQGKGLVLKQALGCLASQYDYALIDCPPLLGILMVNALAACEHLVLPVQSEFLALKGLERMMRTLKMIMQARRDPLQYTIVATMFDRRTRAASESLQILRNTYAERVWDSVIPVDTRFREASKQAVPLPVLQPESRGARAYAALLNYLQGRQHERFQQVNGHHG